MGGYFISNDLDSCGKAIDIFKKKGLSEYVVLPAGKKYCVYFYKKNAKVSKIKNDIFKAGDNFLFGTGVYIYKNLIGKEALECIYEDFVNSNNNSIFNRVKGHFNFVIYKNGELFVVTDKSGTYHTYYGQNRHNLFLSTSFLSVCENIETLTVQKQEILEYINTSVWQGYKSVFKEVNKLHFGQIFNICNNKLITKTYYDFNVVDGECKSFETVLKSIKDYFLFLKRYDENISCDLSGGADSRVLLSAVNAEDVKYRCYCIDCYNDYELAENIAKGENLKLDILHMNPERINNESFIKDWERLFYLFDMSRPMFEGAVGCEIDHFNMPYDKHDLIRLSGHAAELTRHYDWLSKKTTLYDFIGNLFQMKSTFKTKKQFIKNIIKKLRKEIVFDNEKAMTYKDINKVYFLLRCRTWAGSRINTSNQVCYHLFPFEDLSLSYIFFNQDEAVLRTNLLLKKLLYYLYPGIGKYPSSYSYSLLYDEADENCQECDSETKENKLTFVERYKALRRNLERFLWGGAKHTFRYNKHSRQNPDIEPFIINEDFTRKVFGNRKFIIKSILKDLNITLQSDFIKDGIFSLEYLLRKYETKLKI